MLPFAFVRTWRDLLVALERQSKFTQLAEHLGWIVFPTELGQCLWAQWDGVREMHICFVDEGWVDLTSACVHTHTMALTNLKQEDCLGANEMLMQLAGTPRFGLSVRLLHQQDINDLVIIFVCATPSPVEKFLAFCTLQ